MDDSYMLHFIQHYSLLFYSRHFIQNMEKKKDIVIVIVYATIIIS